MASFFTNMIIRPPRTRYNPKLLKNELTLDNGQVVTRETVVFNNKKGQQVVGSFYKSPPSFRTPGNPCVIYLHGNASSQIEGTFLVPPLLINGISVLTLDLAGSGMSDGQFISLGYHERDDVESAVQYIRNTYCVQNIVLWGRSMGAAIAAWVAANPKLKLSGIICDSPYISLNETIDDLKDKSTILRFLITLMRPFVNRNLKKLLGISIEDIDMMKDIENARVPALFVHTYSDSFIGVHQTREIFAHYGSFRKLLYTPYGDHGTQRPKSCLMVMFDCMFDFLDLDIQLNDLDNIADMSESHFSDAIAMMSKMYISEN